MTTAKLFKNGRSQAVRLPKEYRFEGDEVGIARIGPMVILFDPKDRRSMVLGALGKVSDDFMAERDQGGPIEPRPKL